MKAVLSLLALVATLSFAQAGGFGGPPPFTNGSPLVTGVDGSYQATARGTNLTGIFRFTYINGVQTSSPLLPTGSTVSNLITDPYNDYVFWVEGLTYRGLVQANINTSNVAGVFDQGSANAPVWADATGTSQTSLTILSLMNGFFTGEIDQNSPYAYFDGTGEVQVWNQVTDEDGTSYLAQGSNVRFKFSGVRVAIPTS